MDSEWFYNSLLEIMDDLAETKEVQALLNWWNQCVAYSPITTITNKYPSMAKYIFPSFTTILHPASSNWASTKIHEKRVVQSAEGALPK